jgi:ribosomal protein S18 acetylase RimI-like enzyme
VDVRFQVRGEVDDDALSRLHARAFDGPFEPQNRRRRLSEHSLSWVDARDEAGRMIGFVNVAWDGGTHAFALDLVVDPGHQRRGVGRELMARAAHEAAAAGCAWLHVDFEVRLTTFYLGACGFTPTAAGVLRLDQRLG